MWHTNANLSYLPLVQRNKGEQERRLGDRRLLLVDPWGRFMSSVHFFEAFRAEKTSSKRTQCKSWKKLQFSPSRWNLLWDYQALNEA